MKSLVMIGEKILWIGLFEGGGSQERIGQFQHHRLTKHDPP